MKTIIMTLITMLTLIACSDSNTKPDSDSKGIFRDGSWVLVSMNGSRPIKKTTITMKITKKGIHGYSGCNSYSTVNLEKASSIRPFYVDTDKKIINMGVFMQTERGCRKAILKQESRYMKLLRGEYHYKTSENNLILTQGNNSLTYKFAPTPKSPPLLNTKWSGQSIAVKLVPTSKFTGYQTTRGYYYKIRFHNGIVSGKTTCRSFKGKYHLDGNNIILSHFKISKSRCKVKYSKETDKQFFKILRNITSYKIVGQNLLLSASNGEGLMLNPK